MRPQRRRVVWWVLTCILALFLGGYIFRFVVMSKNGSPRYVWASASPAGSGSVVIVKSHFYDGPIVQCYALDPLTAQKKRLLGTLPEGYSFDRLAWSRDGSVVLLRCLSNHIFAYDFLKHEAIEPPSKLVGDIYVPQSFQEREAIFLGLINSRGGPSESATPGWSHEMGWWESYRFGK